MAVIDGDPGPDFLSGDESGDPEDDTINGLGGDDTLLGKNGNDVLNGGSGDDDLEGGGGADTCNGGGGIDKINIFGPTGVTVNLRTGRGFGGYAEGDIYSSIENAQLTVADDKLIGSDADNIVLAFDGNDTLQGFGGADVLDGGIGNDRLEGGDDADNLSGDEGNDKLFGDDGDDFITGGAGADSIDGGDGLDVVSYLFSSSRVVLSLITGRGTAGDANGDRYAEIEWVYGSNGFNDVMTGNADANSFAGYGGDDKLLGNAGIDNLYGGFGEDTLTGGEDDDFMDGGGDADSLNGGLGFDRAGYASSPFAVTVNLATGNGSGGDAEGDKLTGIEAVTGSGFSDDLTGDAKNNALNGGAGNDTIDGGKGNDAITGGSGADTFTGGGGADSFVFALLTDSDPALKDTIVTFSHAQHDLIDVSIIDSDGSAVGDQAFSFIGKDAFSGAAGELRAQIKGTSTIVQIDSDGDKDADFQVNIAQKLTLVEDDFIL